jgi:hypothetical protein
VPLQGRSEQRIAILLLVFTVIQRLRPLAEDAEISVIISGPRIKICYSSRIFKYEVASFFKQYSVGGNEFTCRPQKERPHTATLGLALISRMFDEIFYGARANVKLLQ